MLRGPVDILQSFRTKISLTLTLHRTGEVEPKKDAADLAEVVERMPFVLDMTEALIAQNIALTRELERAYKNGD